MNSSDPSSTTPATAEPKGSLPFAWLRWTLRLGAVACSAVCLYALSFGPAMRLNQQGSLRVETLEKLYLPLMVVSDLVPGMPGLLESYARRWLAPVPQLP